MNARNHSHVDEQGKLVRCYHYCRHWLSPGFLAGWIVAQTITFPLEHAQWEKVWPFYLFTNWLEKMPELSTVYSYVIILGWIFLLGYGILYASTRNVIDRRGSE